VEEGGKTLEHILAAGSHMNPLTRKTDIARMMWVCEGHLLEDALVALEGRIKANF
jgi:hypothetical protein